MKSKIIDFESAHDRINELVEKVLTFASKHDDEELVIEFLDCIEEFLDNEDYDDRFGTEGWERQFGYKE